MIMLVMATSAPMVTRDRSKIFFTLRLRDNFVVHTDLVDTHQQIVAGINLKFLQVAIELFSGLEVYGNTI